jgi:uncharacterized repeat protein (TIGR01451 family)
MGSLAVGSAPVIEVVVTPPTNTSTLSALASVASDTADTNGVDNSTTILASNIAYADLSVVVDATPQPVHPTDSLVYKVTVENAGPSDAENVQVVAILPDSVTFSGAIGLGWSCSEFNLTVTCTRASLSSGVSSDIDITVVTTGMSEPLNFSVSVDSDTEDLNIPNNSDSIVVDELPHAELEIVMTAAPNPIYAARDMLYTLRIKNNGPDIAENVVVKFNIPTGATWQSGTGLGWTCSEFNGVVTCTTSTLAVGIAPDIVMEVQSPNESANIVASASVESDTDDLDLTDNQTGNVVVSNVPHADLELTLTLSPQPTMIDREVVVMAYVHNYGPSTAENIDLDLTMPSLIDYVSGSGTGWNCADPGAGTQLTCNRLSIAPGTTAPVLTLRFKGIWQIGQATLTFTVSAVTEDLGGLTNNTKSVFVRFEYYKIYMPIVFKNFVGPTPTPTNTPTPTKTPTPTNTPNSQELALTQIAIQQSLTPRPTIPATYTTTTPIPQTVTPRPTFPTPAP